jgi:hypothetical protein
LLLLALASHTPLSGCPPLSTCCSTMVKRPVG